MSKNPEEDYKMGKSTTVSKAIAFIRTNAQSQIHTNYAAKQYSEIEEFANKQQIQIVTVIHSDIYNQNRDKLTEAVNFCRANSDVKYLIVTKLDRISRNLAEYIQWKSVLDSLGVTIKSVRENFDDSPTGKLIENMYISFAQHESNQRSQMVKENLRRKSEQGYSVTRPPFGYVKTDVGGLFKQTSVTPALARYLKLAANGRMSISELRENLSRLVSNKNPLSSERFKSIVANPYYAGFVVFDGQTYKGIHEPIITSKEHKKLKELLNK